MAATKTRWSGSWNAHTAKGARTSAAKVVRATESVAGTDAVATANATSTTAMSMTTTATANVVVSKARAVIPVIADVNRREGAAGSLLFN